MAGAGTAATTSACGGTTGNPADRRPPHGPLRSLVLGVDERSGRPTGRPSAHHMHRTRRNGRAPQQVPCPDPFHVHRRIVIFSIRSRRCRAWRGPTRRGSRACAGARQTHHRRATDEMALTKIENAGKEAEVRRLSAQGMSSRAIAVELAKQGLSVNHSAVNRFLRQETEDRRDAARLEVAKEAKESVPLATKALRQIVIMNLTLAQRVYQEAMDTKDAKLSKVVPRSVYLAVTSYSKAATAAARALHGITMGTGDGDDTMRKLQERVTAILASADVPDDEGQPALH